jgi:hypothetical protein
MDGFATLADPAEWAKRQFGAAELGDARRTKRLVRSAALMAVNTSGSIPQQAGSTAAMKGMYRLFDADAVTHEAVMGPHIAQTRELAGKIPTAYLLDDTAQFNLTGHQACEGLGPIGSGGKQRGLHQHSVLSMDPTTRRPLGLMYQKFHCRKARGPDCDRAKRRKVPLKERESYWWIAAIKAIGSPPAGVRWVHVGDRGADIFGVFDEARATGADWLIRAGRDRALTAPTGAGRLFEYARSLPAAAQRTITVRRENGKNAEEVRLSVAAGLVGLKPVKAESCYRGLEPVECNVARVWEADPKEGVEPLEWILLTSLPCGTPQEVLEVSEGYALRWMIEEFHKCEKTGCQVESRRLTHVDRLEPLYGLLSVLAVWLLTLKFVARDNPDQPASELVDEQAVRTMAKYLKRPAANMTIGQFWRGIGRLGGHMGRARDGPIGWLRAWRGWQAFQLILLGARLAGETCG